jgi:hypothetical protein
MTTTFPGALPPHSIRGSEHIALREPFRWVSQGLRDFPASPLSASPTD